MAMATARAGRRRRSGADGWRVRPGAAAEGQRAAHYANAKKVIDCLVGKDNQVKTADALGYFAANKDLRAAQIAADPVWAPWAAAIESAQGRTTDLGADYTRPRRTCRRLCRVRSTQPATRPGSQKAFKTPHRGEGLERRPPVVHRGRRTVSVHDRSGVALGTRQSPPCQTATAAGRRRLPRRRTERLAAGSPQSRGRAVGFAAPLIVYLVLFYAYPLYENVSMSLHRLTRATYVTGEAPFAGLDIYREVSGFTTVLADRGPHRDLRRRLAVLPVHDRSCARRLLPHGTSRCRPCSGRCSSCRGCCRSSSRPRRGSG